MSLSSEMSENRWRMIQRDHVTMLYTLFYIEKTSRCFTKLVFKVENIIVEAKRKGGKNHRPNHAHLSIHAFLGSFVLKYSLTNSTAL